MYSRGFGMETDGGFREVEREAPMENVEAASVYRDSKEDQGKKGILGKFDAEDLLLIGIALLLLTDGEGDNDMIAILLIALLLF